MNDDLKETYDEYYENLRCIRELIRDTSILTEKGVHKYYRLKSRNKKLREYLCENGVKV